MKKILITFLMMLSFNAMDVTFANQNTVNQYVQLSLALDTKTIQGPKAKWSCHFPVIYDSSWIAWGENIEDATQRLRLLCIKEQCKTLGEDVKKSMAELQNLSEEDFLNFLEFTGRTPEEMTNAVRARNNYPADTAKVMTCNNSESFRTTAFNLCVSVAIECQK